MGRKWEWIDIRYCIAKFQPIISERRLNVQVPLLELLEAAANDNSSIVRRVSAENLIRELEILGDSSRKLAEQFANDKSNAVSERGRFALKTLDGSEPIDV